MEWTIIVLSWRPVRGLRGRATTTQKILDTFSYNLFRDQNDLGKKKISERTGVSGGLRQLRPSSLHAYVIDVPVSKRKIEQKILKPKTLTIVHTVRQTSAQLFAQTD